MKLKIGKTTYSVEQPRSLDKKWIMGRITYQAKRIEVATHLGGRKRSAKAQQHTLWHEIVHGMLYEAGGPYQNEELVNRVAEMIQQVNKQLEQHGTT